jgi:ubiquinone/menaquinone biosynthesis C-methylase UbiE
MGHEWHDTDFADDYLSLARTEPHLAQGTAHLLELIDHPTRVLDIGTGDGRILELVLDAHPEAEGIGVDNSDAMLAKAKVPTMKHDFAEPLPDLGDFDLVTSCMAIHHMPDDRKKAIYAEVFALLQPGGMFLHLEHVAPGSERLHHEFYAALGVPPEDDPSDQTTPVDVQLKWLRDIGFCDVDCMWKWRELALMQGRKPAT